MSEPQTSMEITFALRGLSQPYVCKEAKLKTSLAYMRTPRLKANSACVGNPNPTSASVTFKPQVQDQTLAYIRTPNLIAGTSHTTETPESQGQTCPGSHPAHSRTPKCQNKSFPQKDSTSQNRSFPYQDPQAELKPCLHQNPKSQTLSTFEPQILALTQSISGP